MVCCIVHLSPCAAVRTHPLPQQPGPLRLAHVVVNAVIYTPKGVNASFAPRHPTLLFWRLRIRTCWTSGKARFSRSRPTLARETLRWLCSSCVNRSTVLGTSEPSFTAAQTFSVGCAYYCPGYVRKRAREPPRKRKRC